MMSQVRRRAATLVVMMVAVAKMVKVQTMMMVMSKMRSKTGKHLITAYLMCDINGMMPSYMAVSLSHIELFSFSFTISLYLLHFSFILCCFFCFMLAFTIHIQWLLLVLESPVS